MNFNQQVIDIQSIPEVTFPEVTVPEVKFPEVKFPEITVPKVTVDDINVSIDDELLGECFIEKQQKVIEIDVGDGNMNYIEDTRSREMLENAWQAINLTETWDFVAKPIYSFMLSQDKRISIITKKMEELGYDNHTGFTFGWTMRCMQYLAQNGVEKFKEYL